MTMQQFGIAHLHLTQVVWPSPSPDPPRLNVQPQHLQHQYDQQLGEEEHDVDRPHQWMKHVTDQMLQSSHVAKEYEMELQKNTWNAHMSNRVSRSRTKSKDIMERARSFERCAAELRSSAPTSRRGSFSSRYRAPRSPSVGNARTDQYWYQVHNTGTLVFSRSVSCMMYTVRDKYADRS